MPWKKGQSGNPLGRLPGEKQFADQLRIVLAEPVDKNDPKSVRKMRRIAEKLAECALNGEPWAICQVADRIDGKATAEIKAKSNLLINCELCSQSLLTRTIRRASANCGALLKSSPNVR